MDLNYIVQNPGMTTVSTRADVNGKIMTVSAEGFECELVSADPMQGSIKLRFLADQVEAAKSLFAADAKIAVSFAQSP